MQWLGELENEVGAGGWVGVWGPVDQGRQGVVNPRDIDHIAPPRAPPSTSPHLIRVRRCDGSRWALVLVALVLVLILCVYMCVRAIKARTHVCMHVEAVCNQVPYTAQEVAGEGLVSCPSPMPHQTSSMQQPAIQLKPWPFTPSHIPPGYKFTS